MIIKPGNRYLDRFGTIWKVIDANLDCFIIHSHAHGLDSCYKDGWIVGQEINCLVSEV